MTTNEATTAKVIRYYAKINYGVRQEYVADAADAKILSALTGRKTVDSVARELIRDLTGGRVTFTQVPVPML